MKHSSNVTPKKNLVKGLGKTAVVAGLGLGLLIPGGTLAAFKATTPLESAVVDTKAIGADSTSLKVNTQNWMISRGGASSPYTGDTGAIKLEAGHSIALEIDASIHVRSGRTGVLKLDGYGELLRSIGNDPLLNVKVSSNNVSSDPLEVDEFGALTVKGKVEKKAQVRVTISTPKADSGLYDNLPENYGTTLNVSGLGLSLTTN